LTKLVGSCINGIENACLVYDFKESLKEGNTLKRKNRPDNKNRDGFDIVFV
jgi:hypothetical protein